MRDVLNWLASSRYATWVDESAGWPVALTIHAFGVAIVIGFMFIIGLRLSGLFRTIPEVMQPLYALELRFFRVGIHIGISEVPKHAGIVNILRLRFAKGRDKGR